MGTVDDPARRAHDPGDDGGVPFADADSLGIRALAGRGGHVQMVHVPRGKDRGEHMNIVAGLPAQGGFHPARPVGGNPIAVHRVRVIAEVRHHRQGPAKPVNAKHADAAIHFTLRLDNIRIQFARIGHHLAGLHVEPAAKGKRIVVRVAGVKLGRRQIGQGPFHSRAGAIDHALQEILVGCHTEEVPRIRGGVGVSRRDDQVRMAGDALALKLGVDPLEQFGAGQADVQAEQAAGGPAVRKEEDFDVQIIERALVGPRRQVTGQRRANRRRDDFARESCEEGAHDGDGVISVATAGPV